MIRILFEFQNVVNIKEIIIPTDNSQLFIYLCIKYLDETLMSSRRVLAPALL